jgi:RNA polymerase sigma-70 factor (ECF subfamily)
MSDVALVRRVLARDEAAFGEFFTVYFPRLYRFALPRLGGNEDAAEEVAQRVLDSGARRFARTRVRPACLRGLCTLCRREIGRWRARERSGGLALR